MRLVRNFDEVVDDKTLEKERCLDKMMDLEYRSSLLEGSVWASGGSHSSAFFQAMGQVQNLINVINQKLKNLDRATGLKSENELLDLGFGINQLEKVVSTLEKKWERAQPSKWEH